MSDPNFSKKAAKRRPAVQTGDRLPPHDDAAEAGVLGCVLVDPDACMDQLDELGVQTEWFFEARRALLYQTLRAMHYRVPRPAIDLITLQAELKQLGSLEEVGGIPYLIELQNGVPSAANLAYYVEIVHEYWQLRQALAAAGEIESAVREFQDGVKPELAIEDVIDQAQARLSKLAELHTRKAEQKIKQVLFEKVIPRMERHYTRGRAQVTGLVTTGFEYLDKIFCGLGGSENGNYHVFAARPNVGKTSLITGMALHAALDYEWIEEVTEAEARIAEAAGRPVFCTEGRWMLKRKGVPVGISSLEMSAESLAHKMLFQRARADLQRWRTGYRLDDEFPLLLKANEQLCVANNILIDDTARENIASIKAKWRRWYRQYGIRFFMLDYIQLIKSTQKRFRPDRVQEMEEISAELQALGKELNCPIAVLAQLNRDFEKEPNRLPRMSDLKNCGAIEQDADSVTILYKPSPYKPFSKEFTEEYEKFAGYMEQKFGENWKKWDGRPERINALVEKNKWGPKGDAKLLFLKSSTLFVDYMQWLKQEGLIAPSKGEESRYKQTTIDPEDVPQ